MSGRQLILASASPRRRELIRLMGIDFEVCSVGVDKGETLGKPRDGADALRMLRLLSGSENTVFTGVCVIDGETGSVQVELDRALVHFVEMDEASMLRYIRSGEPMDKAGAYGVQGMGGMFVSHIEGSSSNVIGLPMHLVRSMLRKIGWQL